MQGLWDEALECSSEARRLTPSEDLNLQEKESSLGILVVTLVILREVKSPRMTGFGPRGKHGGGRTGILVERPDLFIGRGRLAAALLSMTQFVKLQAILPSESRPRRSGERAGRRPDA